MITQEQIDAWPRDESSRKVFPKGASFGKWASFGKGASFGEGCKISGHTMKDRYVRSASAVGNSKRTLYAWNTEDGWFFQAGCRFAPEDKFRAAVTGKYGDGHDYHRAMDFLKSLGASS